MLPSLPALVGRMSHMADKYRDRSSGIKPAQAELV